MPDLSQYPAVTIIVPAHNEELVIERTVATLLALRYPEDRLTLLIVNDASTDGTAAILDRLHEKNPRVLVYHRQKPEGGQGKAAALNAARRNIDAWEAAERVAPVALVVTVAMDPLVQQVHQVVFRAELAAMAKWPATVGRAAPEVLAV